MAGATNGHGREPTSCYACMQSALEPIPRREAIVRGEHWRVAHAFNSSLPGWLVVLPMRHVEALHELSNGEAAEFGPLLVAASQALRDVTGCVKTYVMLFAEADGFAHLHLHVVPRLGDLPDERQGPRVFQYLADEPLPESDIDALAARLTEVWPSH